MNATLDLPLSPLRSPVHFAAGRCIAAIIFTSFGALSLALSLFAFGLLHWPEVLLLVAVPVSAIVLARSLRKHMKSAIDREPLHPRQAQDDRTFGWVNAAQGLSIFLLFAILPHFGHQEFACPGTAIIVGLHFLFMPPLYRSRSNTILGVAMMVWGILSMVLFRGNRMIASSTLGAGLLLWTVAAWALHTASSIARRLAYGT